MNYKLIYDALIERARQRELKDVYFEKHHVVPKCMGGSNDRENIVKLLAREHFISHELLVQIHPNKKELLYSFNLMCNSDKYGMTNKKYEWIKIKLHEAMSGKNSPNFGKKATEKTKKKMSKVRIGIIVSDETKQKLSELQRGEKHNLYGTHPTDETRKKMSVSHKGERNGFYGKHHTDDTRKKNSDAKKGQKYAKEVCIYCGKEMAVNNINKYHNEKCKFKSEVKI